MTPLKSYLDDIQKDKQEMLARLESWVNINSGSENLTGLGAMLEVIEKDFAILQGKSEKLSLPPRISIDSEGKSIKTTSAEALRITKHPEASFRLVLGGHMDTVYPASSPFQKVEKLSAQKWRGPGITDMKGGIIIMLKSLELLEKSSFAGKMGWEVLINPDEEIGSACSEHLFKEAAKRAHIGLIFEPSFPDGALVSARKGTMNYTVIAHGKSAHAGRDFYEGRNAITALAKWILSVEQINDRDKGITVNVGQIEGGHALNIVPDLAICRVNLRVDTSKDFEEVKKKLHEITIANEGIHYTLHKISERNPKPFDQKEKRLFEQVKDIAGDIGIQLDWRPSGGVCDGNILAGEGLPTIDTLGVIGGHLHTDEEYLLVDSIVERTRLTTAFLLKLAEAQS